MRRGRAVIMGMRVRMAMPVMMVMGVRNHLKTLYYNITDVHGAGWMRLRLPSHHGDGRGQEGQRKGDRCPKPDETGRHEGDFPEQETLEEIGRASCRERV